MAAEPALTSSRTGVFSDYVELTKPRIMVLLLITMVGTMAWAQNGLPPLWLVAAAVLGMGLSSAGASAINHALDRDLDRRMERTRERPVAAGRVTPTAAIVYGALLTLLGVVVLYGLTTPLAALMALVGNLFYVVVYTIWLKRRTPQNIVIGGAAGAMPPLVGWAAVTGQIALAPVFLFGLIFLWTPPHFWALALVKRDEYADAGVPMLPVVRGVRSTTIQIAVYTAILVAFSLAVVPLGLLSWAYGIAALLLGAWFLHLAIALHREGGAEVRARATFRYSLYYLAAIFVAIALDRILLG